MRARSWVGGALAALMLVSMPCSAAALEFVQPVGSPYATTDPAFVPDSGGFLGGEAVGDFNGDGISDVAVVDATGLPVFSGGESVTVLLGSRSGALTVAPGSPVALYSGGIFATHGPIASGDFNGDGKLDLAVVDEQSRTVSILLGNGTGEFELAGLPISYSGSEEASIVVGDFNGDGREDLAIAGTELSILLGSGSGGFTPAPESPLALPGFATSLVAGDFNGGDHRTDLAAAIDSGEVAVYLSSGGGRFQPAAGPPPTTDGAPLAIAAGNFTGTGPLDVATANPSTDTVTVLLGDGAGGFRPASGSPFPVAGGPGASPSSPGLPESIAVGDFSCDGKADIAAANFNGSSDTVAVLQGDGGGGFTNAAGSPFPANGNPRPIAVDDFNGDGSPDIAVVNGFLGRVTVLENTTKGGSCKPVSPISEPLAPTTLTEPAPQPGSEAPSPHAAAPVIESLTVATRMMRARRGITFDIELSRAGSVVVEFDRAIRVHGRKLLKPAGKLTFAGRAGANRFTITRVGGHVLASGSYILWVFTKLGAERSARRSITIDIRR
jgi:hypothetical protein